MWTPENITALCTGIAAIIGTITTLIVQIRHASSPDAHGGAGHAPGQNPGLRLRTVGFWGIHSRGPLVSYS